MVLGTARDTIRLALDNVQRHPDHAERLATRTLARHDLDPIERAEAMWLLGRAQHERDEVDEACRTLEAARTTADANGEATLAAEIGVSEAVCRMTAGDTDRATALLDDAEPHLDGAPRARLVMQRGLVELYRGALHDALVHFDDAIGPLRDAGDDVARCRLLANRGVVHTTLGDLDLGAHDFDECRRLAVDLDLAMIAAGAAHNLGFLAGRRGDFPDAFAWFERARSEYERVGFPQRAVAVLESDLCSALLSACLFDEADRAAHRAAAAARRSGNRIALADALLLVAQTSLARGDHDAAKAAARESAALFSESNRDPLIALARYCELRAEIGGDPDGAPPDLDHTETILDQLERHGWRDEAQDVRLFIGRTALDQGRIDIAERHLTEAAEARRDGPWLRRADGWLAVALLRRSRAENRAARRALTAAFRIVDAHQATLAASDLRAHVTTHSAAVVELGLEMARESESPEGMLEWAERHHARSMRLTPATPQHGTQMSNLLQDLRAAHAVAAEAAAAGHHDPAASRQITDLEGRIRVLARTGAVGAATRHERDRRLDVAATFVERALIEHVRCGDDIIAITAIDGCLATHLLGSHDRIIELQRHALAALRRLAFGGQRLRALDAAQDNLTSIADELDELLLGHLDLPVGLPTVIVPTGEMRSLPWSMLPTLRTRSWALAPSAALASRPPRRSGSETPRALLISGPGLEHADDEVMRIAARYDDPVVLTSTDASADRIVEAMADADVVHIAAHGHFRADSPLFSSIELADGPVTVYDLEHVGRPPSIVVLSACEAGRVAVRGGDELLGTAAALLQLGVGAVIAPVTAVPDHAVVPLMDDLHRGLHRGMDAASALRRAQATMFERGDHSDIAAAGSFVAMAADHSTPRPATTS